MLNSEHKKSISIMKIVSLIITIGLIGYILLDFTYAAVADNKEPDTTIKISSNGHVEGDIWGDSQWYPGYSKSGVIRIDNDFKTIKLLNLGIEVNLIQINGYQEDIVLQSFLENMKLSINKRTALIFNEKLIENICLKDILGGQALSKQFTIKKDDYLDIEYTLTMDEKAGNELENIKAVLTLLINDQQTNTDPASDPTQLLHGHQ